jgi:hypothetical protein
MCSNGSDAFAVPAGTPEFGSEPGPRVPVETLEAGYVALADGPAAGLVVLVGAGVVVAPGAGVAPWLPGEAVPTGAAVPPPGDVVLEPGTFGDPPITVPPPQAARPSVAAPADFRIKPLRVMRNRDIEQILVHRKLR